MTYRVGEVERLRASQSMDPSQQPAASEPPAIGAPMSGPRHATMLPASPAMPEASQATGSRFWIVGVVILLVLLIAAIVLLRMAQSGAFLSL